MVDKTADLLLEELVAGVEVPDSAYETAEARYHDLAQFICRPESVCSKFQPHISVQGSFRLGTVNRPLNGSEPFDLDLVCNLKHGIYRSSVSQEHLKQLVGRDLESYREARRIKEEKKEKHRCWRLEYADELPFHMDILPSIPESMERRELLLEAMVRAGAGEVLAKHVASLSISLTDDRHRAYRLVSEDWFMSNPMGFAKWFESRMKLATMVLEKRLLESRVARIDDLPVFRWKTPLQKAVQLLKRHRDILFKENCELKPASNILTTLAGAAYQGESNLAKTIERCLDEMGKLVRSDTPHVSNPVNPAEDFADKWDRPEGRTNKIQEHFWNWLVQAKADFKSFQTSLDTDFLADQALKKFGVRMNSGELLKKVGLGTPIIRQAPRLQTITEPPARPWMRG